MAERYRVVSQRQTTDITPGGRFADVMEVACEASDGTPFQVRIPVASYTAAAVDEAADRRAAHILSVTEL